MRELCRNAMVLARFGLGFALAAWATSVVSLAMGGAVAAWHAVVGLALGGLAAVAPMPTNRERAKATAVVACAACLALWAAHAWPDLSHDGLYYHQPATYALADGWNALWDGRHGLQPYVGEPEADIVQGYPKAAWLIGASLYRLTGNENSRHALHWLLMASSFGCVLCWIRASHVRGLRAALLALLCCASPVALYQASTSYVDGMVASLLCILVAALLSASRHRSPSWAWIATVSGALLVGLKFTGLVYAAILLLGFALAAWRRGARCQQLMAIGAVTLSLGLALAADSYVANAARSGNPFYPAVGQTRSVMNGQASREFLQCNRVVRLAKSLASPQYSDKVEVLANPQPRLPFTAWRWQRRHDPRFSGFGPLTFEIAILTILLWLLRGAKLSAAGVTILLSTLATEAGWWARIAPQLWILPILLLVDSSRAPRSKWLGRLLVATMLLNVLIVASASLRGARADAREWAAAAAGRPAAGVARYLATESLRYAATRRLRESKMR